MAQTALRIPHIVDHIINFDRYGNVNLILALGLKNKYIQRLSDLINNTNKHRGDVETFLAWYRLRELLTRRTLYSLPQSVLDNLPVELWYQISFKPNLKKAFRARNAHNLSFTSER